MINSAVLSEEMRAEILIARTKSVFKREEKTKYQNGFSPFFHIERNYQEYYLLFGCGGGIGVNIFAFYSRDLSSNPTGH